jgi:3-hydroxy-9,10-secoandrosta-1,3,5(10)-triene-9,17-dione monooxygenase reductase component
MFATGVTIVTARADDQTPVGITVNSFNSVSLDPPMVLWSIAKTAKSRPVFSESGYWNVHILAATQEALSNRFARAGEDKFLDLVLETGVTAAPLIPGCSARFQCRTAFQYDGGDHIIFVGEVMAYDRSPLAPLLYVTGGYALALPRTTDVATGTSSLPDAPYSENLLGYLLGRAHYQFMAGFRPQLEALALNEADFFTLSLLSVREPMPLDEVLSHTAYTGAAIGRSTLDSLCDRHLLQAPDAHGYRLSQKGREVIWQVLAAAKAVEADLVDRLGEQEAAALRNLLKKSILASDPGLPKLWSTQ